MIKNNNNNIFKLLILIILFINFNNNVHGQQLIKSIDNTINLSDFIGIGYDYISSFSSDVVSQQITYIKQLNYIGWVRISIAYNEFAPNVFNTTTNTDNFDLSRFDPPMRQLNASGLNTIVYFTGIPSWFNDPSTSTSTYPTTANDQIDKFAKTLLGLAKNYTFVKYWQVWDQMNNIPDSAYSYQPNEYNSLFQGVSNVFKDAGLSNKLSIGSVLNFGEYTPPSGTSNNMITDLINLNTYNGYSSSFQPINTIYPEGGIEISTDGNPSSSNSYYQQSNNLISNLKNQGKSPFVYTSKWGWSSSSDIGSNEIKQANYTIKRLFIDLVSGIDKSFLYTISDYGTNPLIKTPNQSDRFYGIINSQLGKKMIYRVFERLFQITGSTLSPISSSSPNNIEFIGIQNGMIILSFKKLKSNTNLIAFYKLYQPSKLPSDSINNPISNIVINNINNGGNDSYVAYLYNPLQNFVNTSSPSYQVIKFNDDKISISIPVTFDLQFLEFPLPPPFNNSNSDDDNNASNSSIIYINYFLLSILIIISIF